MTRETVFKDADDVKMVICEESGIVLIEIDDNQFAVASSDDVNKIIEELQYYAESIKTDQ